VVGNVEPSAIIQVKSQVTGELKSIKFTEGGNIKAGDLLFEIDARPYREALKQAEAAVQKDSAQLRQAEANLARDAAQLKNADVEAGRYDSLVKEGVVSRAQRDQFRTNADALKESIRADQAAIESARASVDSDRSAVDRAKLDLSYCEIRSPVTGRAGTLLVHAGNLVKANADTALVIIHQVTPIFVSFNIPERYLPAVRKNSAARKLAVRVTPQDNTVAAAQGFLSVIDNTVDATTGTVRLKATFPNQNNLLWPGQFVNVVLTMETLANSTVVPSEAVQSGQDGQMIYVVKPDQTVEPRKVTVGRTIDTRVLVEHGVTPGETVVTDGQLRLFPGARIKAVPAGKLDSGATK
jgi:multidrug efflux system membrane fusion protein